MRREREAARVVAVSYAGITDLFPWEPPACGEGDRDGRVEVGAGYVADGVHHYHDGEPPHDADARKGDHSLAQIYSDRSTSREDQKVCPEYFSKDLNRTFRKKSHHRYQWDEPKNCYT